MSQRPADQGVEAGAHQEVGGGEEEDRQGEQQGEVEPGRQAVRPGGAVAAVRRVLLPRPLYSTLQYRSDKGYYSTFPHIP